MASAALGLRVKSGWATVVLLVGTPAEPIVVDRREVQLADPDVPASRQPYHAALATHRAAGAKAAERLAKVVRQFASRSVPALVEGYRLTGHRICGAGIVVGSVVDPTTIGNEHIRAHAEEGRLFRTVLEDCLRACGLRASIVVEKEIVALASRTLGVPEPRLRQSVSALGRPLRGPWRADEKSAALAAWMALKGGS